MRLNAFTSHKHAVNPSCVLEARARSKSIVPPLSPGEDTISLFTIIVDNVTYPLVDTYSGRARGFKGD